MEANVKTAHLDYLNSFQLLNTEGHYRILQWVINNDRRIQSKMKIILKMLSLSDNQVIHSTHQHLVLSSF